MTYEVNPYLSTQNEVLAELITIFDLYQYSRIDADEFENVIQSCMEHYFALLVKPTSSKNMVKLNGGAKAKLGKKRIMILGRCLERRHIAKVADVSKGVFEIY